MDIKRYAFNDTFRQTENVISGRITQYRKPLSAEATERLSKYIANDGYLDGDAVAKDFHKFLKRYAPWQIGDTRVIQQPYREIWRNALDNTYRAMLRNDRGWNNKYMTKSEHLKHAFSVERIRLEKLSDTSEESALQSGAIASHDHKTGELLGYLCDGDYTLYDTPQAAYTAAFMREWECNADVWCWVYDIKVTQTF